MCALHIDEEETDEEETDRMRKRCHSFDWVQHPALDWFSLQNTAEAQQTGNLLFVYSAARVACSAHGFFPEVAPSSADADPHLHSGCFNS